MTEGYLLLLSQFSGLFGEDKKLASPAPRGTDNVRARVVWHYSWIGFPSEVYILILFQEAVVH
jgi:hypothetical protein